MRKTIHFKTKTLVSAVAVLLFLFLSSCNSYRNGFIKLPKTEISNCNIDSIQKQKEWLNSETIRIISALEPGIKKVQVFQPHALNQLFENMHCHLSIDTCYQILLNNSVNDSVKEFAHKELLESAAGYHQFFQNEKNLRRLVNRGDKAFGVTKKSLLHSQKFLWAHPNRELLKMQIPTKLNRHSKCWFLSRKCADNTHNCIYKTTGFFSEIFSRSIAHIHKKPTPKKNILRLMPYLKKWDIVIQKSPGRLTDKFIPGHFGHAAIYMGDSLFIEGIQSGVILNDPIHFAEGRAFLVIRLKEATEEKLRRISRLAMGQIGKKYDFNFDVGSPGRLVCTELISIVFDDLDWQMKKRAGVFTLSPDGIIRNTIRSKAFDFPLYFDEEQLVEWPSISFIEQLLLKK